MNLLSINIPTYERLESFSEVLLGLVKDGASLNSKVKELVSIIVIDNDSSCWMAKKSLCTELQKQYGLKISFRKNEQNVGGPINVHNAHCASPDAKFTWVLGDDDHVVEGSLNYITRVLLTHEEDLGLLVLSDRHYRICPDLAKQRIFTSYFELARVATKVQPHFLIAHTLISCNVFRSKVFLIDESMYALNELYVRYDHWTGFSHMRGLLSGLFRSKYFVILADQVALDTSRRQSDVDFSDQILDIYYFHYLWILTEIGVRTDQVKREKSMYWLYKFSRFDFTFWRGEFKPKEALRKLLILFFGERRFKTLRKYFK